MFKSVDCESRMMKYYRMNPNNLKLYINSLFQPLDIKSLFLLDFGNLGIDYSKKICLNSINHQGG